MAQIVEIEWPPRNLIQKALVNVIHHDKDAICLRSVGQRVAGKNDRIAVKNGFEFALLPFPIRIKQARRNGGARILGERLFDVLKIVPALTQAQFAADSVRMLPKRNTLGVCPRASSKRRLMTSVSSR